ncbi:MAG TPA: S41 family peptidase [Chloroflexia bacterium]|nr:S41 family peptidase [Chloroflexia bacterium]
MKHSASAIKKPVHLARLFFLFSLVLLLLVACDASGLPVASTPSPTEAEPSPTRLAPRKPTIEVEPSPTTRGASITPTEEARSTRTPIRTATATPTAGRLIPTPRRSSTPQVTWTATPTVIVEGSPTPTLMPINARRAIFEEVWQTVQDVYIYEDFNGVDWDEIHNEYELIVLVASSAPEFYDLVSAMVAELGDEHSRYLSPMEAQEEDNLMQGTTNYVGIGILATREETSMTVVYVFPGSPAEEVGLKRRDRIIAIDGEPVVGTQNVPSKIRGPEGTTVTLTIRSPGATSRDVEVERRTITGQIEPSGHRLAANPEIGYLIIPDLFLEEMDELVEDELRNLLRGEPLEGLVVDIRGNGGGLRTVMRNILGHFITGNAGTFYTKTGSQPLTIPQGRLYDQLEPIPVVVLIDGGTESAAEWMAGAVQAKDRATVVGVTSAGNTETVYPYDLTDGSRLWVAQESFKLPDGTALEGRGVVPDVEIDQDWTAYSEEKDPHILEAVKLLKQEAGP